MQFFFSVLFNACGTQHIVYFLLSFSGSTDVDQLQRKLIKSYVKKFKYFLQLFWVYSAATKIVHRLRNVTFFLYISLQISQSFTILSDIFTIIYTIKDCLRKHRGWVVFISLYLLMYLGKPQKQVRFFSGQSTEACSPPPLGLVNKRISFFLFFRLKKNRKRILTIFFCPQLLD